MYYIIHSTKFDYIMLTICYVNHETDQYTYTIIWPCIFSLYTRADFCLYKTKNLLLCFYWIFSYKSLLHVKSMHFLHLLKLLNRGGRILNLKAYTSQNFPVDTFNK